MSDKNEPGAKERILEAGRIVFAEKGFSDATIRDICGRAGANVAAVNYHFKGKAGLFEAVLGDLLDTVYANYPPDMDLEEGASAEEQLYAFVRSFLLRIERGDGRPGYRQLNRVISEAVASPSPLLDFMVEKYIFPLKTRLRAIVQELLGEGASDMDVRICSYSIVGQVLHYFYNRAVAERLLEEGEENPLEDLDGLAQKITRFSLGGVKAMQEGLSSD